MEITSKNIRQKNNIKWLLKQDGATYESLLDGAVQVVKYSPKGAYPCAAIFKDKKKDPVSHYRYTTEERREEAIQEAVQSSIDKIKWKEERKAKAKKIDLKIGDIIYTSWGYEQTNIDFYLVTGLVGTATAEYTKIGSEHVKETSWCSADVKPNPEIILGDIERGRIGQYGVKIGREYASVTSKDATHHSSWGY